MPQRAERLIFMDIMKILFPVLIIGGMGLVFGSLLAIAAKVFAVKVDEKIPKILNCLPGANCGGCGFAGCSACAEAIAKGEAAVTACPGGNSEKIAEIMGASSEKAAKRVAYVRCGGDCDAAKTKYIYKGASDCIAAARLGGGAKMCAYGCLGLGSCAAVCPTGAISLERGVAKVDRDKCIACEKCVKECPKGVISIVGYDGAFAVACASRDKGKIVRTVCQNGCIGCGICAKVCLSGAAMVVDNVASIDTDKCANCGMCAEKCPQKVIVKFRLPEEEAVGEFVRLEK